MGGKKKKYIEMFGSFMEPFYCAHMPFMLPPMTRMGTSGNWSQALRAQVCCLIH